MSILDRCGGAIRTNVGPAAVAIAMLAACGRAAGDGVRQTDSASATAITDEASAFMDAYARDLTYSARG